MAKISIAEKIEKIIDGLKEKEKVKKKELKEIQDELKKYQKALEPFRDEISNATSTKPRRKKVNEQEARTDNPV